MTPDRAIPLARNESYWMLDGFNPREWMPSFEQLSTYPSYEVLQERIAEAVGVGADSVLVTPGSDAAIAAIAAWCAAEGRTAIVPLPTFYGYERILATQAVQTMYVRYAPTREGLAVKAAPIIAVLQAAKHSVVFLCQPNNPLGSLIEANELAQIVEAAERNDAIVVVDEAYAEFSNPTLVAHAHGTIVVLRTFSKSFGLAGARVGYVVSDPRIRVHLASRMLPWPVAHPSVHAALWALAHGAEFEKRRIEMVDTRERFIKALAGIRGCEPVPSRTNFVFAWVGDGKAVAEAMKSQGILVAPGSSLSFDTETSAALAGGIRMSVPSPGDFDRVVSVLARVLDDSTAR